MPDAKIDVAMHTFHSPAFESVVSEAIEFLEASPTESLPPASKFTGAGVYALYYKGPYPLYQKIATNNQVGCNQPIYVGKAVHPGWRTGRATAEEPTPALFKRLREHAHSIDQGSELSHHEFRCRFMILDGTESDLVSAVEAQLIRLFSPLWNSVVDGFGNHDPGKGRYQQALSEWDVLHPGRPWAERLTGLSTTNARVIEKITRLT